MTANQEFVAALVHGRRSRMAEGTRLQALCHTRTLPDLAREVLEDRTVGHASDLQLRLVQGLAQEGFELACYLDGRAAELLRWMAQRFEVENLKMLIRRVMTGAPREAIRSYLVPLAMDGGLDLETLSKAESMKGLVHLMPRGSLRRKLNWALDLYHEQPRSFFFEAALDGGYFRELLDRVDLLPSTESRLIKPVVLQELDLFHLMLVTRGKFIYDLEPEALLPLHLPGTRISRALFAWMLAQTEFGAVASRAGGRVVDAGAGAGTLGAETSDPGVLERLAWSRFWRLANRAFRCSHMGSAAVAAYFELRRVEVINLITICESIRMGSPSETLYGRLIPLAGLEAIHV